MTGINSKSVTISRHNMKTKILIMGILVFHLLETKRVDAKEIQIPFHQDFNSEIYNENFPNAGGFLEYQKTRYN